MYIKNPFRIKDWPITDFIKMVVIAQALYLILTFLSYTGLQIQLFTDLIGFFLILIVPGTIIVRFMNLNRIESNGQLFILTIGLSLVSLMLIGFLMNLLYPFLGINKPLSPPSILVTINLLILFTCLILY